ncbi:hypothetical protein PanWU01x14_310010 [Parasponia andersonii]|uniref:Uncharacterized protein n=1 Tax=Parasponia andersonii TaxID=3476 RepID=A0A2P5AQH9_PARAD|nr:hypothetical protein PanWU01x14_310010 [Parasponia andersonii]
MAGIDNSDGVGEVMKLTGGVCTEMKTSPRGVSSLEDLLFELPSRSRQETNQQQSVATEMSQVFSIDFEM